MLDSPLVCPLISHGWAASSSYKNTACDHAAANPGSRPPLAPPILLDCSHRRIPRHPGRVEHSPQLASGLTGLGHARRCACPPTLAREFSRISLDRVGPRGRVPAPCRVHDRVHTTRKRPVAVVPATRSFRQRELEPTGRKLSETRQPRGRASCSSRLAKGHSTWARNSQK
jgi:hypothetical protein